MKRLIVFSLPILILILFLLPPLSLAKDDIHFHNVTYHRCYHAHSCFVSIPGVPAIFGDVVMIRLAGIQTPEILGSCEREKKLAEEARNYVNTVLLNSRHIDLFDVERGENFNLIANIIANGENVSQLLVKKKYAVSVTEKTPKPNWCKK